VRPNLRSRLHFCHAQEGGPRNQQMTCGGIGGEKNLSCNLLVYFNYFIVLVHRIKCKIRKTASSKPVALTKFILRTIPSMRRIRTQFTGKFPYNCLSYGKLRITDNQPRTSASRVSCLNYSLPP